MDRTKIEFSCGHEGELPISKIPNTATIDWYRREGLCPKCYKNKTDIERSESLQDILDASRKMGFAPLTGTEKQIAYAESIRHKVLKHLMQLIDPLIDRLPASKEPIENCVDWLRTNSDSNWWINKKDSQPIDLLACCPDVDVLIESLPEKEREMLAAKRAKHLEELATKEKEEAKLLETAQVKKRIKQVFGKYLPVKVGVWKDKRVYVGAYGDNVVEYYHEGNAYHEKGEIVNNSDASDKDVGELCDWLCRKYKEASF